MTVQEALNFARRLQQSNRHAEAENVYRQIIAQQPRQADALELLGVLLYQTHRFGEAIEFLRKAVALHPNLPEYHFNLGLALKSSGDFSSAIAAYRDAIRLKPDFSKAYFRLGVAQHESGQHEDAIISYRHALHLDANYFEARNNLGVALQQIGQLDLAVESLQDAVQLNPQSADAHNNLGSALLDHGRLDEALTILQTALKLNPNSSMAHNNLGNAYKDSGRVDLALCSYRQAAAMAPNDPDPPSNVLYTMHYDPACDAQTIAREHEIWNQRFAEPLKQFVQPHRNDRDPDRRLKVGYVSPFFRDHCQALFLTPLLANHDHESFEITCYSDVFWPDQVTEELQKYADVWRHITGLPNEALAEQIRRDRIDILIDLSLHMDRNRLLVFARKPAPVQITWLGYPASTGLSAIDYRITDPFLDPAGSDESIYSERSIRLPETFWCYDPLTNEPAVNPLPALTNGFITFGCFNNFCKVNAGVLDLWKQVLDAVPNSRLLILCDEGSHRPAMPPQVQFVVKRPRAEYLKLYHQIDLVLDTFPYNGHTTSLDGLWMGVPMVTLVGPTAAGRAGFSQLSNLGLTELAAKSAEEYVQIAKDWASDLPRLAELRSSLRQKMRSSPLMDGKKFAKNMETVFRDVWRRWCATK